MARVLTAIFLLLAAAGSEAAEAPNVSVLVPIVGSIVGMNNVRWKTDVDLFNDSRFEANVMLSLPTAPDQPFIFITIAPGAAQHFSDTFRTNVGLANLGEHEAIFTLALQRGGRNVAVTRYRVSASALVHTSVQSLFPMITKGDDFTVLVETSAPDTYIYASVIDNETNQTHFIQPSISSVQAQEARNE